MPIVILSALLFGCSDYSYLGDLDPMDVRAGEIPTDDLLDSGDEDGTNADTGGVTVREDPDSDTADPDETTDTGGSGGGGESDDEGGDTGGGGGGDGKDGEEGDGGTDGGDDGDTSDGGTDTEDACEYAVDIDGYLDSFQIAGDGRVLYCHSGSGKHYELVESDIDSCFAHLDHEWDVFPTTLCDS